MHIKIGKSGSTEKSTKSLTMTNYVVLIEPVRFPPYGFKQGYFDRDKVIAELEEKGIVRIPFSWVYDVRQYDKHFDGCFMEISKINMNAKD